MKAFLKILLSMSLVMAMIAPAAAAEEKVVYHVGNIDSAMGAIILT